MTSKFREDFLKSLAREAGLVLLYHATFEETPDTLKKGLHSIKPATLRRHLQELSSYFRFVEIDEYVHSRSIAGLACVTFDDGYKGVPGEVLPILEDLNISATLFVNGSTLEGKTFWRDKVRHIINNGWEEDFKLTYPQFVNPENKSLYRFSKHPANDSRAVEQAVDEFLKNKGQVLPASQFCFADLNDFVGHRLLSYGNHSHNHYVMSSLSAEAQFEEVEKTKTLLASVTHVRQSNVFSIPFGGDGDYDKNTIQAVRDAGYDGVLLSRSRVQKRHDHVFGMSAWERFMPKSERIYDDLLALV